MDDLMQMAHAAAESSSWKPGLGNKFVVEYLNRFAQLVAKKAVEADRALLEQALEALKNGKRVRNAEGGTKFQPTLEDAAIASITARLIL